MVFQEILIDRLENATDEPITAHGVVRLNPGARIIASRLLGPTYLNRHTQIGPDAVVGRYFGMNEHGFVARATIGSFCAFGARNAINPFNHPVDWLSIHEFQYHPRSFDWIPEYAALSRIERTPDMFQHVTIGSDVWTGHNVNILPGVNVGDGAVIGAGSVVTKDVPPFAIVAGVPAKVVRLRFSEPTIERLLRLKWWELELCDLSGLPYRDVERCLDRIEEIRARKPSRPAP
jgi:acetyltransferase-like isoleucine patch superfamily enzyme